MYLQCCGLGISLPGRFKKLPGMPQTLSLAGVTAASKNLFFHLSFFLSSEPYRFLTCCFPEGVLRHESDEQTIERVVKATAQVSDWHPVHYVFLASYGSR